MFKLARRLYYWLYRNRFERELAEEIQVHQLMKQDQLEQSGMTAVDASRRGRAKSASAWPSAPRQPKSFAW